jgi:hypothetical protein
LKASGFDGYLDAAGIVGCYHERGSDELANRALKDFGHEQLPFKKINPNAAWYYCMLVGHFLMECFKKDVAFTVVPIGAYATTVRRRLIDIAGKIVSHGGNIILKGNYSAAIHQDGEKPVLFVPYFFRELLGFLLNRQKLGLKASNRLPVLAQKAFESFIRKKVNVTSQKGLFSTKASPY